jgi:flagellar assembly protein FliH
MVTSKRILGAEEIGDVRRFELSELRSDGPMTPGSARIRPSASREPPPGYREGFRRGVEEGIRRGSAATEVRLQREHGDRLQAIADHFTARADALHAGMDRAMGQIRAELAEDAMALALEIARQIVRAELRTQPSLVETVVREAVASLVDERASFHLHLHPDDADLFGAQLEPLISARGARIVPDPSIEVGGCRVISAGAEVDATVSTRWRRVLAAIGAEGMAAVPSLDAPRDTTGSAQELA